MSQVVRAGLLEVAMLGSRFIAISTDPIIDGKRPVYSGGEADGGRYTEQCILRPINTYREYNGERERRLLDISGDIVIPRTHLILNFDKNDDAKCSRGVKFVIDCIHGTYGTLLCSRRTGEICFFRITSVGRWSSQLTGAGANINVS